MSRTEGFFPFSFLRPIDLSCRVAAIPTRSDLRLQMKLAGGYFRGLAWHWRNAIRDRVVSLRIFHLSISPPTQPKAAPAGSIFPAATARLSLSHSSSKPTVGTRLHRDVRLVPLTSRGFSLKPKLMPICLYATSRKVHPAERWRPQGSSVR